MESNFPPVFDSTCTDSDSLERVRVLLKRARHVDLLRRELPTPAGSATAHWCGRVWSVSSCHPRHISTSFDARLHLQFNSSCPRQLLNSQRCNSQKLMRFRLRAQKPNHTDLFFPQNPKSQIHYIGMSRYTRT